MKFHPINRFSIIEASDEYFDDVHNVWRRVPAFWVGDFVASHSHRIRSA